MKNVDLPICLPNTTLTLRNKKYQPADLSTYYSPKLI